jgi:coenzyme F420-dependent glucose-6-phosphate dehydrogenase
MVAIGYKLCSEEHRPEELVRFGQRAEAAGFDFAMISDHYHPWTDTQGQSPFVWSVLGALVYATRRLRIGTGVTCPTMRTHPAVVAHAAATIAAMMPGRFLFGVGTGENLNEHILGQRWPPAEVRREMLEEAVAVMRLLWQGGLQSHRGTYYTVANARLYTLPSEPPPVLVAASGPKAAELAGRIGDGLLGTAPEGGTIRAFEAAGGAGKPRYGELTVCWARSEAAARRTAREQWPIAGLFGPLTSELALPGHFEAAAEMVQEEALAKAVVCGPDPERHLAGIRKYEKAGYDHVWVHQIGPDQEGFFRFYEREILPRLGKKVPGAKKAATVRRAA